PVPVAAVNRREANRDALPGIEETGRQPAADALARGRPAVERRVRKRVGGTVLGSRDMPRAPARESAEARDRLPMQGNELRVAHAEASVELLDDELRIEEQLDLPGAESLGGVEGKEEGDVLGHVIGRRAERLAQL